MQSDDTVFGLLRAKASQILSVGVERAIKGLAIFGDALDQSAF